MKHKELSSKIIGAFYNVYNKLGYGFLEKVYGNALFIELRAQKLYVEKQHRINVFYKEILIGDYYADLIVNNEIIIELKAEEYINPAHEAQLVNYLKATEIDVGLLLNFGKEPEAKRKIFDLRKPSNLSNP